MKRIGFLWVLSAVCLLVLYGCVQNVAPPSGKVVRIKVPNLMSG